MIRKYLSCHKSVLLLYIAMLIFLPLIQYLSGTSLLPTIYGIVIISFLLVVSSVNEFINFRQKILFLEQIEEKVSTDRHPFPEAKSAIEKEYQQIIELLYDRIQAHEEMLVASHKEQEEYYTLWVHQIKTPISAMRLALQSDLTKPHQDLLELELFKIEQYVELALQYTKIKNLSSDLVIREYELEDIVSQSIKKYAPLFIYKRLSVSLGEFHKVVTTDSKWLSFLLEQLLSNAIKYTNQGQITLKLEHNKLMISDTGIGIREEDKERIFEKGYTGYNGRVDKKASGIGLYLSKKVADALSIKLEIRSNVGEGTTATLVFLEKQDYGLS